MRRIIRWASADDCFSVRRAISEILWIFHSHFSLKNASLLSLKFMPDSCFSRASIIAKSGGAEHSKIAWNESECSQVRSKKWQFMKYEMKLRVREFHAFQIETISVYKVDQFVQAPSVHSSAAYIQQFHS